MGTAKAAQINAAALENDMFQLADKFGVGNWQLIEDWQIDGCLIFWLVH